MATAVMIEGGEGTIGRGIEIETALVWTGGFMGEERTIVMIVGEEGHYLLASSSSISSSKVRMTCGRTRQMIIGRCRRRGDWGRVN